MFFFFLIFYFGGREEKRRKKQEETHVHTTKDGNSMNEERMEAGR